jgi:peptidyl-prolyl cis-trans isomerase-like 3
MAVTLHTTLGDLKLELFCDECPHACENFLALCASGRYDGTRFHRVIKGFIMQGGDPTGTGRGGTSVWGGRFEDELRETLKHAARGTLAYASSGPNTNGSQFYLTFGPQKHLDGKATVFGRIIHGLETLAAVEKVPTDASDVPLMDVVVERVTIHANPLAA